jgi:hypothetical protein
MKRFDAPDDIARNVAITIQEQGTPTYSGGLLKVEKKVGGRLAARRFFHSFIMCRKFRFRIDNKMAKIVPCCLERQLT